MSPLRVIATTPTKGLKPSMFLNQPVHQHYFNLQAVLERIEAESGCPGGFKNLFARPVIEGIDLSQAEKLDWMTELPGEGVPFPSLPQEKQVEVALHLKQAFARIKEYAETNRHKGGKESQYAEFLCQIAVPSDPKCIFVFGVNPVITTWGFSPEGARDPAMSVFLGWDDLTGRLPKVPTSVAPKPPPKASGAPKPAGGQEEGGGWLKWVILLLLLLLLFLLWRGCNAPPPPLRPVSPATGVASAPASLTAGIDPGSRGNISFTLVWTQAGSSRPGGPDIDLQVNDPQGRLLSSSNVGYKLGPTPEGGRIDRDDRGGWGEPPSPGGGPERAYWPDGKAPLGTYTFGVCYFKGDGEVDYILRVYDRTQLVLEKPGHLSPSDEGILREVGQVVLGGGAITGVTGGEVLTSSGETSIGEPGTDVTSFSSSYQSSSAWQVGSPGGTTSYVSSYSSVHVVQTPPNSQSFSHVSSTTWIDQGNGGYSRLASEVYQEDQQALVTASETPLPPPGNEKRFSLIMDSEGSFLDQALESDPLLEATTWDLQDPQGQTFVSDKAFFKDAPEKFRTAGPRATLRLIGPPRDKPYEVKVAYTNPDGTRIFVFSVTTR